MAENIVARITQYVVSNKISVAAPAAAAAVQEAEVALRFTIPRLLKSIYLNVGNGGFGPGYGIIGVAEGHASNLGTLVETYDQMQKGAEYFGGPRKGGPRKGTGAFYKCACPLSQPPKPL